MKYTIEGFSQPRLVAADLDAIDAHLLRWWIDFSSTGKMKHYDLPDGTRLFWVRYAAVIEDLPVLGIANPNNMARRFMRLVERKALIHETVRVGGTFSYFGHGPVLAGLMFDPQSERAEGSAPRDGGGQSERAEGSVRTGGPNDSSTRDHSTRTEDIAGALPGLDLPPAGKNGNGHKAKGKKHTPEETTMFQRMGDLIRRGTVDHAEAERRKERGEARGPAWSGVKDSQALWRLIGFAQEQQPARTEEYLTALLEGAWALHQGEVSGMTDWDKRRWSAVPHVPSCLEGAKIEAALTAFRYGAVPEVEGARMSDEDTRELMANLEKVGRR